MTARANELFWESIIFSIETLLAIPMFNTLPLKNRFIKMKHPKKKKKIKKDKEFFGPIKKRILFKLSKESSILKFAIWSKRSFNS